MSLPSGTKFLGKKIRVSDDIKYLLFTEVYLRFDRPTAKRKAFTILEAAISSIAKKGFEQATVEMIAREAGVSRTLVKYYFASLDELAEYVVKYIRLLYQKFAVAALTKGETAEKMLTNYIEACFIWIESFPLHSQVWHSFLHRCARSKKARLMNTHAVHAGHERLTALLELGLSQKVFNCDNPEEAARMIQVLITGGLWSFVTEDIDEQRAFVRSITAQCLNIASPH